MTYDELMARCAREGCGHPLRDHSPRCQGGFQVRIRAEGPPPDIRLVSSQPCECTAFVPESEAP